MQMCTVLLQMYDFQMLFLEEICVFVLIGAMEAYHSINGCISKHAAV